MQKQLLYGVPYYTDKQTVHIWDPESIVAIGTYQDTTKQLTFYPDILDTLSPRLIAWRAEQKSRVRKPTTNSRRTRTSKGANPATEVTNAETDE